MKAKDIKIGGLYVAKVSGKLTTVRVDAIREVKPPASQCKRNYSMAYDVTNIRTGRKTTFRSAAKFRSVVTEQTEERRNRIRDTYRKSEQFKEIVTGLHG